MIVLNAYAKLNLSLDITGVRKDGYHELDTLMQSISLFDTVTIEKADGVHVRMDEAAVNEKSNTAYAAAAAFARHTNSPGADISIRKRIPQRAGLGGSSADAAAVLVGLDRLYGTRLDAQTLARIGQTIGADVPFALLGGTARAQGIGEKLTRLFPKKYMHYVVVKPLSGVSTAEAFKRYRRSAPVHIDTVQYAVLKGDINLFCRFAENALGIAALGIAPEIMKAANALMAAGAKKALLTGSGSSMFAPFETAEEAASVAGRIKGGFALCGAFSPKEAGVEITEFEDNDEPV